MKTSGSNVCLLRLKPMPIFFKAARINASFFFQSRMVFKQCWTSLDNHIQNSMCFGRFKFQGQAVLCIPWLGRATIFAKVLLLTHE